MQMGYQDEPSDVPENIFCSKCGNQESAGSRFCYRCGAPLAGTPFSFSSVRENARVLVQSINENIDKVAIASVVIALIGLLIGGGIYAGLGAIGLGLYAKRLIEDGRGTRRKLAVAGIWLGVAVSVIALYQAGFNAGFNTGVNTGYTTGVQAGMQAGRTAGEQETWDSIGTAIGSLFGL